MSYLVDTNVISELVRPRPAGRIRRWFESIKHQKVYVSVITLGEIRKGIEMLSDGHRKEKLGQWLQNEIPEIAGNHLLPVDRTVADQWGRLMAACPQASAVDALLAATALVHRLVLATRNTDHFRFPALSVVNPWEIAG